MSSREAQSDDALSESEDSRTGVPQEKQWFDTMVLDLFSLHKESFVLFVSKQ